ARLGQPAPVSERSTPDDVDFGRVRLDLQRLPVMVARLDQLALISERQAPVGVGFGRVRLELQGLPVVLARLDQLTLLSERQAPVGVGVGVVRLDPQGCLEVLDRLSQLALPSERQAQAVLTDGGSGINGSGMAPKFLRVVPDLSLVPGENSQAHKETDGTAGNEETRSVPAGEQAGTGQDRPAEACQVGISISGNLRAALND